MAMNSIAAHKMGSHTKFPVKQNSKPHAKPLPDNTPKPQKAPESKPVLELQKNEKFGLSQEAQDYLATLKDKFGDVNFVVGSSVGYVGGSGGKQYNCFIDAGLLERMAKCEETAKKYEGVIAGAIEKVDDLKQQVSEKGLAHHVKSYNVSVNSDGSVDYSVLLRNSLKGLYVNNTAHCEKGHPRMSWNSALFVQNRSIVGFTGPLVKSNGHIGTAITSFYNKPLELKADNINDVLNKLEGFDKGQQWNNNLFLAGRQPLGFLHTGYMATSAQMFSHKQSVAFFKPMPISIIQPVFVSTGLFLQRPAPVFLSGLNINHTYTSASLKGLMSHLKKAQTPAPAPVKVPVASEKGRKPSAKQHSTTTPPNPSKIKTYERMNKLADDHRVHNKKSSKSSKSS